jgi:hypothetical protein
MLLLHQGGSVKIGEVVRYTITYTPAHDRILPSPPYLFLKIKNTSAIALRAAFVHGPYTLYAAAYPATFNPNEKFSDPRTYGVPEFEPQLKAGGTFTAHLVVPEEVRKTAGKADRHGRSPGTEDDVKSVNWVVEVASQVIFSNSAAVHYEVFVARDEKSLNMGFATGLTGGSSAPAPGQVSDHQQSQGAKDGRHSAQPKGVYSRAIKLRVDDTASLWNTPKLPEWGDDGVGKDTGDISSVDSVTEGQNIVEEGRKKRQKKVHLVILTHGLHSNLGADMLFLKESIDATARQAKIDAKTRRANRRKEEKERADKAGKSREEHHDAERKNADGDTKHPKQQQEENLDEEEDDEEVIVRGFSGNAVRTERGIKYLGKRLARYILAMTYPDQPFKPVTKKSATEALSHAMKPEVSNKDKSQGSGDLSHPNSTIIKEPFPEKTLPYKITSISFIAHSLGGLIQMYAVAYIQKHSPEFFDRIKPVNFIALASPFLGLSNENPLYVKFALDFGLVGRTGQDLGLTWRAPTIARSGWGAIVSTIGEGAHKKIDGETAPESKPLLRILPTGPAHTVLKKFRNRTVYSNVVNDGVVPLRTSCLLFLDWQGLGRVEKARRENGLVGTMASWGWAELTGANSGSPMRRTFSDGGSEAEDTGSNTPTRQGHGEDVPQPPPSATVDDDGHSLKSVEHNPPHSPIITEQPVLGQVKDDGPLATIMKFFTPSDSTLKVPSNNAKPSKIYKRSQTLRTGSNDSSTTSLTKGQLSPGTPRNKASTGDVEHADSENLAAPPKTTFFESAGDLLKPPLPPVSFLIDPSSRPRTIFHDRVYHPEDIPPPPLRKRATSSLLRRRTSLSGSSVGSDTAAYGIRHEDSNLSTKDYDDTKNTNPNKDPREVVDGSAMKVEEKIARAYHRDLSWRKVLVRLEPDAHNNMIVRRMFANAYGWPVVKHLCDTHFSDSAAANTRDEDEGSQENAKDENKTPDQDGRETNHEEADRERKMLTKDDRTDSEAREANDNVPQLMASPRSGSLAKALAETNNLNVPGMIYTRPQYYERAESDAAWSDRDWADSEIDSDDPDSAPQQHARALSAGAWNWAEAIAGKGITSPKGTHQSEIDKFLSPGRKSATAGSSGLQSPVMLGKDAGGRQAREEGDLELESDAAAARLLSGEATGIGLGLGLLSLEEDEGGAADSKKGKGNANANAFAE